jgi:FtsP/CotA-like multicopper oxidase with cupredoxin domain
MNKIISYGTVLILALALMLSAARARAEISYTCPPDTDGIDTNGDGNTTNDNVCYQLAAGDGFVMMADGRQLYMFGFSDATNTPMDQVMQMHMLHANEPAPTIIAREGDHLYVTITNVGMAMRPDLFDPHSIHFHGFANAAPIFDGMPDSTLTIKMGASQPYYYNIVDPGTYIWHCHVEATEHMQMGMLGQLYILPIQDNLADGTTLKGFVHHTGYKYAYNDGDGSTHYDVEAALQLGGFDPNFHEAEIQIQPGAFALLKDTYPFINGRGYPDTVNPAPIANTFDGNTSQKLNSIVTAQTGQKVLLRLSNLSVTAYYTVTVLDIPMQVVGEGARLLRGPTGTNLYRKTNSITLGGGETTDVILDTTGVAPGTYFLYSTNLNYLSNNLEDNGGMMTEITITP